MKFGRIVLPVNMHQLTESDVTSCIQDSDHDVISRRKALPSDVCTHSVCPVHMQQRPPVPDP